MFRIVAKALVYLLTAMLALVVIVMGASLLRTYREYAAFKEKEVQITAILEQRQAELRERQEYLRLVLEDPAFVERVVREKLGFTRPTERVYRFGK